MNKITINLLGGLGNQLHCYAFGYALSQKLDVQFELDCDSCYWNDIYGREYLLDHFENLQVNKKRAPKTGIGRRLFKARAKFFSYVSLFLPIKYKLSVLEGDPPTFRPDIFASKYIFNPTFTGYWASFRYLSGVENDLRKILKPPSPVLPEALNNLKKISDVNACFIHYRSYSEEAARDNARPPLMGYYSQAISRMVKEIPDVQFFVFSDDCDLAKVQLSKLHNELNFVDIEDAQGNQQSLIDFYLMYRCRHAIIGDSTFSWWAAWLSYSEEKIVICPHGLSPWGDDWTESDWLKIEVL